jgi:predicted DNA-binding transcriptional regulator YafY
MRGDQPVRQWKLLMLLWRNPDGLSAVELAKKLKTPLRTIYRDLHVLMRAGFKLRPVYDWKYGFWVLDDIVFTDRRRHQ